MATSTSSNFEGSSPLRNPIFRSLWLANVASNIGSTMHDTAAVWTMTSLTSSPTIITLMQSMSSLPLFLFGLVSGTLADILERRKIILGAQAAALAVASFISTAAWCGLLNAPLLLAITFALGTCSAFTLPAWQALIPEIVSKKDMPGALTLGGVGFNIARAIGPMVGGLLVAGAGPAAVFSLNAVSYLGIVITLWQWKAPSRVRTAQSEQMLGAMAAAIRYARHSQAIHAVLIRSSVFVLFGVAPIVLLPIILRNRHADASTFGILLGCYGAGGIVSAFLVLPKLRARLSTDQLLTRVNFLSAVAIGLLSVTTPLPGMAILMFIAGGSWLASMSSLNVAAQTVFPNWVRARSSAIQLLAIQGALATGAIVWGQITAYSNTRTALWVSSAGLVASLILRKPFPLDRAIQVDLTPSNHWLEHQLAVEPSPEDGPVVVTLDYNIKLEEVSSFRKAIASLRKVRLRDGAFRWSMLQDLNEPNHFREAFLVVSWAEHLRQHERATLEDKRIEEAVLKFHIGPVPPKISHYLMRDVSVPWDLDGTKSNG